MPEQAMRPRHLTAVDAVEREAELETEYSVCTLVTDWHMYAEMVASFRDHGFQDPRCEFLYIDNTEGNQLDGYQGVRLFLRTARGRAVVLVHQDVRLISDDIEVLNRCIAQVADLDPNWGVLGNAGGDTAGHLISRITDPHTVDARSKDLPQPVTALDENFLVVRRNANLSVSTDLGGFHLYATDLCLVADVLGCSCWVIDFHVLHLSPGNADESFADLANSLKRRYRHAFRARWTTSPTTEVHISGSRLRSALMNTRAVRRWRRAMR